MVALKPLVVSAVVLATPISAISANQVSLVSRQIVGGLLGGLGQAIQPVPLLGPLLAGNPGVAPAPAKPVPAPVYPAPAPAPAPAPVPVRPAPAPAPAPVPVRPAPVPAPAPVPVQSIQISASVQVVTTIQFFSTRSASINQFAQALVTADVSLYAQGQGNLSVFTPLTFHEGTKTDVWIAAS
jgi:hypothetical protein